MATKRKKTMTELLREAIREALRKGESLRGIARASGVKVQVLSRFLPGEFSLLLTSAETLAAYFGLECRRVRRNLKPPRTRK